MHSGVSAECTHWAVGTDCEPLVSYIREQQPIDLRRDLIAYLLVERFYALVVAHLPAAPLGVPHHLEGGESGGQRGEM